MTSSVNNPTPAQALAEARADVTAARDAANHGDRYRQGQYARAAIDAAATAILDPDSSQREIVAARFFLRESLGLDGRANDCGADSIDTEQESCGLSDEDREWLANYLNNRRPAQRTRADSGLSL